MERLGGITMFWTIAMFFLFDTWLGRFCTVFMSDFVCGFLSNEQHVLLF